MGFGLQAFIRPDFMQLQTNIGMFYPIKISQVALTPFGKAGIGLQLKDVEEEDFRGETKTKKGIDFGFSVQAGLQFTTAAVPGLFIQAGYQFNWYLFSNSTGSLFSSMKNDPHILFAGLGYSF